MNALSTGQYIIIVNNLLSVWILSFSGNKLYCSEINCSKEVAIKQESSSFMMATKLELACREDPDFKGR